MVNNMKVFLYQFVLPFLTQVKELTNMKARLKQLEKIRPGNNKAKQNNFKKSYVKLWSRILELLKSERAVRANVNYVPQLQLICYMENYIESKMTSEIFNNGREFTAQFLIYFFDLRNEEIKKRIIHCYNTKSLVKNDAAPLMSKAVE
jgi:hypothetical protein